VLAHWEGHSEQAIGHLREAAGLATDLGLPAEQWQIQAALGNLYEEAGETVQARIAFGEAATIIQGLARGIGDETRRARFLAGLQIQPVLQHVQGETSQGPQDPQKRRKAIMPGERAPGQIPA
jgi:tetratricopeptide (TPR) repeat protein